MPTVLRYTNVPIETLPAFTTKQANIFLRDKFSNQCTEYKLDTNNKFENGKFLTFSSWCPSEKTLDSSGRQF